MRFEFLLAPVILVIASCGNPAEKAPSAPSPASSSDARREVPAQPSTVDTRPVIVAFGDSLSAGFGVDAGKSYPDDLQKLIDAAGYRYHVVNLGVSGDTTTDGVARLPAVIALHPAIVILEFGGNDGLRGLPVSAARENLVTMIKTLRKSGAAILLAGMTLPRNYGPEYIHSFEQMYLSVAAEYMVPRIPFLLEGVGGHADLTQPDGIHPTAEGAQIVARTVMQYLEPLLGHQGNRGE